MAGKKVADLLQFSHPGSQFTHRATVEIAKRKAQKVIDHLSPQALIDPVGGFSEQKGFETVENPIENGHSHESDPQHLQGVEAALTDHLVDDHLDQQRIGEGEQLNHKTGGKHLDQHAAVAL